MQQGQEKKNMKEVDFFTEYGDANRYQILEVIGKGSYGVVCAAIDTHTGEKVAIKKINDVFEHISDALRILREVKLLRLLRHPDIVEIKSIMLPPSKREFRDIYVVFELMESDLHQVIKANDDLTKEHHQFFLYQMLRALKYMHTANVYHRDLKPKNILANANCKLKVCDFGLARVSFNDTPTTVFWTDYVATRWYRAPELCGSFCSKYTPAIDIWSIGCIFAEVLLGKPLFPGKSVVHQLELITDLLGTPKSETIAGVRNEKARKYLGEMRKKSPIPFTQKFPNADPSALRLLQRLLAFDPKDRPTATEALADPYFKGLAKVEREPSCQPISKMEFEFERRRLTKDDIRELIYREILEYHPQLLKDYMNGSEGSSFLYPSAIGHLRKQFAYLEENSGKSGPIIPPERKHASLPRSTVHPGVVTSSNAQPSRNGVVSSASAKPLGPPPRIPSGRPGRAVESSSVTYENSRNSSYDARTSSYYRSCTPQQTVSPNCFFNPNAINHQEKRGGGTTEAASQPKPQFVVPTQCNSGKQAELNPNPYIVQSQQKVGIDAKLLHAQSQYGPAGAAAVAVAAHRSVGTVGYGMS
ncbi:Protein kinase domain-containing protein [Hirschfeldia incana]|nr:Protein kinase domain-containing protein [Hirschfeldia incana]